MKQLLCLIPLLLCITTSAFATKAENLGWPGAKQLSQEKASILFNEIPYVTDQYCRVSYTLQLWLFDKENLTLEKIIVVDDESKKKIFVVDRYRTSGEARDEDNEIPKLVMGDLGKNPFFEVPELRHNYITLQIPLHLGENHPARLSHIFYMKNNQTGTTEVFAGAELTPRYNEQPLVIESPIKGKNLLFMNQSTMAYHLDAMLISTEGMGRGERFAFDYIRMNDDFSAYFNGNHAENESYLCYGDTIYAVADGVIDLVVDGLPENSGDSKDVEFKTLIAAAGNYISQELADGNYACYAHCIPGSILVKKGDRVVAGQAIARVGNSGNSDCPHLHFQITKGRDLFLAEGVPFVLREYTLTGKAGSPPIDRPVVVKAAMMEQFTVIDCKRDEQKTP